METIDRLLDSLGTDAPVRQILVGTFWTAVMVDTDPPRCGLASTLRAEGTGPWPPVVDAGRLLDALRSGEAGSLRETLARTLRSTRDVGTTRGPPW